jgi:hypothetical protein
MEQEGQHAEFGRRFDDTEREFYERGESLGAAKQDLDGFHGSCSPRGLRGEHIVLILTALAGGGAVGGVAAGEKFGAEGARVEVADKNVQRVQDAFSRSAQRVRSMKMFETVSGPLNTSQVAQDLATYPVQDVFSAMEEVSGVPAKEIARRNQVETVNLYVESDISAIQSAVATRARDEQAIISFALDRVGINLDSTNILINMDKLLASGDGYDTERFYDVTTHELIHGFEHRTLSGSTGRVRDFYEGMTEAFANRVGKEMSATDEPQDAFHGYVDGATATAELLLASTNSEDALRGYLHGDLGRIGAGFNAEYGKGAFESALKYDDSFDSAGVGYERVAPMIGMIETMGVSAPEAIKKANAELATSKIHAVEHGNWHGVLLVGEEAETGINNGALRIETKAGTKILVFSPEIPESSVTGMHQVRPDVFVLYDSLHTYTDAGLPISDLGDKQIDQAIQKMLNAYDVELNEIVPAQE